MDVEHPTQSLARNYAWEEVTYTTRDKFFRRSQEVKEVAQCTLFNQLKYACTSLVSNGGMCGCVDAVGGEWMFNTRHRVSRVTTRGNM